MKETVNSWLISNDPYDKNKYNKRKLDSSGSSFKVCLCTICYRVYEDISFNGEGKRIVFHQDFPTYKMKRETCPDCGKS